MRVFRIVKNLARANDLSGTGAYKLGGRWNSKGTFMLYTSENSSLAYLETLVHVDPVTFPPNFVISQIEIVNDAPVYVLPDPEYPNNWLLPNLLDNKMLGDRWMNEMKYLAIKVRSVVNPLEYNYLLNPLFPEFSRLVNIVDATEISTDVRLK
jgi:RES domain-containing protein